MGCVNLPAFPSRNRERETCCTRSTVFLYARYIAVNFSLLDRNDSVERVRC